MLMSKGLAGRSGSVLLDAASASSSLLPEVPPLCRGAELQRCDTRESLKQHPQSTERTLLHRAAATRLSRAMQAPVVSK